LPTLAHLMRNESSRPTELSTEPPRLSRQPVVEADELEHDAAPNEADQTPDQTAANDGPTAYVPI
jgi:hypothetical protein